eukprot:EG_transcript_26151
MLLRRALGTAPARLQRPAGARFKATHVPRLTFITKSGGMALAKMPGRNDLPDTFSLDFFPSRPSESPGKTVVDFAYHKNVLLNPNTIGRILDALANFAPTTIQCGPERLLTITPSFKKDGFAFKYKDASSVPVTVMITAGDLASLECLLRFILTTLLDMSASRGIPRRPAPA